MKVFSLPHNQAGQLPLFYTFYYPIHSFVISLKTNHHRMTKPPSKRILFMSEGILLLNLLKN